MHLLTSKLFDVTESIGQSFAHYNVNRWVLVEALCGYSLPPVHNGSDIEERQ